MWQEELRYIAVKTLFLFRTMKLAFSICIKNIIIEKPNLSNFIGNVILDLN